MMDRYWEKRQVEMYKSCEGMTNRYFGDLQKAFLDAKRDILKEINDFYMRYAGESGLSYQDAQKRITETELGGLNDFIRKAYDHIGEYDDEVERLSIKSRVTRLQEMEARINAYLDQLYAIDYQHNGEELLHSVSDNAYYRTWYNIDQFKGVHDGFNGIDPRRIDKMIEYPFNGQNFSTRIWKQKEYLGGQLMESFTQMLVQGKNPKVLAADFAKKFGTSEMAAYRLLHTEASYIIAETAHAAYKEDGVEEYVIIAALDSKTCPACGAQDGKHYPVKDAVAGVNMEPFHPNCRCTDAPYFPDFDAGTRTAKDDKGKNYEVPADMTYEEWKKKYVDNTPENAIIRIAKENGIKGIVNADPKPINLINYSFNDDHINVHRKHGIDRDQAERFMKEAAVSISRWNGRFVNYYGENGAVFIYKDKKEIKTAFGNREFDEKTAKFIKEIIEYGKR